MYSLLYFRFFVAIATCSFAKSNDTVHFSYYCNYGVLLLVMTGQAPVMSPKGQNASRDDLVKLWGEVFIICNTTVGAAYYDHE